MSKARNLSDFISDATIDSTEIADLSVTHAKLHTDVNLSSKTLTFAANQISGNSVDGGVISNFASTGIDDNASATAVTILSDGKVGIGTSSPSSKLHVNGGDIQVSAGNSLKYSSTAYITPEDNSIGARVQGTSAVTLWTSSAEAMRIDSSGNVGIGTTSPNYDLVINNSSGPTLRLDTNLAAANASVVMTESNGTSSANGGFIRYNGGDNRLELGVGTSWNTTRMVIARDTGNVGIGTETPRSALQVVSGATRLTGGSARFGKRDITGGLFLHSDASTSSHYNWMITTQDTVNQGFEIIPSADPGGTVFSTPAFVITGDDRKVGIGTSSPDTLLELRKDTASTGYGEYPILSIRNDNASGYSAIHFQEGSTQRARVEVGNNSGTPYMGLYTTSGASGITIKSGNVGIGTTTPYKQLQVKETSTATTSVHYPISIGGSNHVAAYATGIGFDPEGYGYRNKIAIVTEGIGAGWSRGKLHILFKDISDNNEATLADSKVTFLENGYVGVGVTSPRNKVHVAGAITSNKGITNGTGLVQTVGRGMYHILATNNYGAGSNVRHAAYYVCVDYEGDDIVATNTIFNNNNMSISFSISGGWLIAGGLPGGNNNISVFGM